MKIYLATLVTAMAMLGSVHAQPIEIETVQNPAFGTVEVEGKAVPSIQFTGKKDEVIPLPLSEDKGSWDGKGLLVLRLHSAAATEGELIVFVRDALDEKSLKHFPRRYHWAKVPVDWAGWKKVEIAFSDLKPSTGQTEEGTPEPPAKVSQIWFGNRIGPEDPAENTWGVAMAVPFTLGIESIIVKE